MFTFGLIEVLTPGICKDFIGTRSSICKYQITVEVGNGELLGISVSVIGFRSELEL
jgi:hypothetical protein